MKHQTILVLDFGGQYKELIARRVRECHVYSVIKPGDLTIEQIKEIDPIGIILTGGPNSVYADDAAKCDPALFDIGIPILGICYGMQLMCHTLNGKVSSCEVSEYGKTEIELNTNNLLFNSLNINQTVLMSHTDQVVSCPEGFVSVAKTINCNNAAIINESKKLYAVQFHPEVEHTENGKQMIRNFVFDICKANGDFTMKDYANEQIEAIRKQVGNQKVLLALSGGVDSSVCATLLAKAIPNQLTCIFVDHGLMRKNEGDQIEEIFTQKDLNFIRVNAQDRFLTALSGVSDPETKRKIIGNEFIRVFEDESKKLQDVKFLAQGTIYPDIIESGTKDAAVIKSHHNVGGLPEDMDFIGLVEPLKGLFKDEVRQLGRQLKLPKYLVDRQPFPGPGLAIRVIGEITKEKLDILRDADFIMREEIENSRHKNKADQYFAVLTNLRSVGVMGDFRTYDYTLALRAVTTNDFMTCVYAKLPHSLLNKIANRIVNEVEHINRIVYDITDKPPATIEWE